MANSTNPPFTIGIVLYPDFDPLDVAGPLDVYTLFDGDVIGREVKVAIIAETTAPMTASGGLQVRANFDFAGAPPLDMMFVPGAGPGIVDTIGNDNFLDFLRRTAANCRYVCSVCTGGILLASAGLLDGYEATTHWSCIDCLKLFKNVKVPDGFPRYLRSGNRFTGGGISSTIDEALFMVETIVKDFTNDAAKAALASQQVQLKIQYNPKPPYPGGDPASVSKEVYAPVAAEMKGYRDEVCRAVRERIAAG
jgi:cyclohexyl-isocyanide hydratase